MKFSFAKLKAVLLDRDGVINEEPGPILTPGQFIMIPGSADAVARLNRKGLLCIVISNQAAFARGQLDQKTFSAITTKMEEALASAGGRVDAQFYCPHHPDWENGKRREVPGPCGCRKPLHGMLAQAGLEHSFGPEEAVLIGDKTSDFEAAARWGCPSIGVRTGHGGKDGLCAREPEYWARDLDAAVRLLLNAAGLKDN